MTTKHYTALTTQGKARRLRKLAQAALADYDLDVKSLRLLSNDDNCVFRVDTFDRQKYVLRICAAEGGHPLSQIIGEMQWLDILQGEASVQAPAPLTTKDGAWLTTVSAEGVPDARHCVVFSWVDGVPIAKRRWPKTWEQFGKLAAKLHHIAARVELPPDFKIMRYNSVFPFHDESCVIFEDVHQRHFSDAELKLLSKTLTRLDIEFAGLYHTNRDSQRVTHGDLHQWNVHTANGKLSAIDFEDIMWAYPIQDIATTLYYNRFDDAYETLRAAFKRGYELVEDFPEAYPGQLETYMLARRINLLNTILASNEADIAAFPQFIPRTIECIKWVRDHIW